MNPILFAGMIAGLAFIVIAVMGWLVHTLPSETVIHHEPEAKN